MSDKKLVLDTMRKYGRQSAEDLQARAPAMTGTVIIAEDEFLPDFNPTKQYLGFKTGYICKSAIGNAMKLIQPYDSLVYTQQPEELQAQWGFYWSSDPKKAKPFISKATSPYMTGDCCTSDGHVWRSGQDHNVHKPGSVGAKWDDLGTVEDIIEN